MRAIFLAAILPIAACNTQKSGDPLPTGTSTGASTSVAPVPTPVPEASAPHSPGGETPVTLPHAKSATPATRGLPMLAVTTKEIRLAGAKTEPIPMPPRAQWYAGMPLSVKGDKPGMYLEPIGKWLKDGRSGSEHDLGLVVDVTITYRIVTEVIYTAGVAGYDRLHFVALTPDEGYAEMIVELQRTRPDGGAPPLATVLVVPEGIGVKTEFANVGPGCAGFGPGLAFPRLNGVLDLIRLPSCLDKITPDASGTREVIVGASPEIPFGEIAGALDAARLRKGQTIVRFGLSH